MRENYMTDLSLEKISEELGVHPNYICSLFNKLMDTTFLHYLDCLRLRKSVEQLLNRREMPVQEIAAVSGFMNERQFYKVFKKRLGLTPGAFRKQYEGTRIKTPS
jgi:YesN/AraC family two-component response regulator